ncbi:MAG: hypothetical protein AAGF73_10745 [Actinomycetota bacterium]
MRWGYALVVGALAIAACSSSESGSESTGSTTTIAADPSTTSLPSTTTSTEQPTTTSTTATPTTEAPTTTASEEQVLADVEAAYFAAREAYLAAAQDPTNEDLREGIADTYTGANLELANQLLDELAESATVAVVDPENAPFAVLLAGPVINSEDPTFAELVVCEINSEIYVPVDGITGSDPGLATNGSIIRLFVRFQLVDGSWLSRSGDVLAEIASADECVPE